MLEHMDNLVEYSCRCGLERFRSYYRPAGCRGCTFCGTILSDNRKFLTPMLPHDMAEDEMVYTEEGHTVFLQCCIRCGIFGSKAPTLILN